MSHKLLFGFVFVAAATIGYSYVLHKDKVQAGWSRICSKHLIPESQGLISRLFGLWPRAKSQLVRIPSNRTWHDILI